MISTQNFTKQKPGVSTSLFASIADDILGKKYELSLVFSGTTRSRRLNKEVRGKDYIPNILSFPYEKNEGEIIITLSNIKREAPQYEMSEKKYLIFLFIHGCLHLKGMNHCTKMDSLEEKYLAKYST